MSDYSLTSLFSQAKSYVFGEDAARNMKVRLQDEDSTEINADTKLRIQDGSKVQVVSVKDYIGSPDKDSQYKGLGDPSTRLKNLLNNTQYRHASNEAARDKQGLLVEPNGAIVVPLQRPKVSLDVERSKVRQGDAYLEADNGAMIVPTGYEHKAPGGASLGNS